MKFSNLIKILKSRFAKITPPPHKTTYEISGCVDCMSLLANGDVPSDRPNIADEIVTNWPQETHQLHVSDGNDDTWFSWNGCECCNSNLGGTRRNISVISKLETA
jgi:hypothetical protein